MHGVNLGKKYQLTQGSDRAINLTDAARANIAVIDRFIDPRSVLFCCVVTRLS